ncbi:hypothetical protein DPMN_168130 [Dreissena polymorpha]|uniref:Uncharacterized protein n=1 Tax=Dreissena polymorpha TaxID=45954 RepID=A0A9D4F1F1_DREPO|nr:hypothetical protein DPMN_168130 [Dreissena polymorpha]
MMMNGGNSIRLLSDITACMREVLIGATRFVSACYGTPETEETSIRRQTLFAARVGKSG